MKWFRSHHAAKYHYRLQVESRSGEWANLVERRTRSLVAGYHGVVDVAEGDLPGIAARIIERTTGSWRNCRVVFFAGDRSKDDVLGDDDVYGAVMQGELAFVPGPAHPGFVPAADPAADLPTDPPDDPAADPAADPAIAPQPRPLSGAPWKDHGLANGQLVECGACRKEITVRLVEPKKLTLSSPDYLRGSALICGDCARLLCIDCLVPAGGMRFDPFQISCDRCGGRAGMPEGPAGQGTSAAPAAANAAPAAASTANARSYGGLTAAQLIDRVAACRQSGRQQDASIRGVLDELRQEYGHPACPFAASLERLAFGTSGPPLYQESMEPDEVDVIDAILQRLTPSGSHA